MFFRVIADIEKTLMKGKMIPNTNKVSIIYPTLHIQHYCSTYNTYVST